MTDLAEWLLAAIEDDERWARAASLGRPGQPPPQAGEHWQWEETETDQVLTIDPVLDEFVGGDEYATRVALRSVEQYPDDSPWGNVGPLPAFAIPTAEEVPSTVAGHIARWDPKRALAECDAKRRIVAEHVQTDYGPEHWGQVRLPPPGAVRGELTGARVYNCSTCDTFDRDYGPGEHAGDGCTTLRLLALPYASRDGYQAEWAL